MLKDELAGIFKKEIIKSQSINITFHSIVLHGHAIVSRGGSTHPKENDNRTMEIVKRTKEPKFLTQPKTMHAIR